MSPAEGMICEVGRMSLTGLQPTEDRFAEQPPTAFAAAQSLLPEPSEAAAWSKMIPTLPCKSIQDMAMASKNKG
jgi:hypothetical protein